MMREFHNRSGAARSGLGRAVLVLLGLYLAGFAAYVFSMPGIATPVRTSAPRADAIVALTGGDARLQAGIDLLEGGSGQRLLITGVHPETTKEDLKHRLRTGAQFDCCTDLGFAATDTRGNAEETATWAQDHGYKSLLVVTAAYHMPRALLEFGAAMPKMKLVPYPVEPAAADPASGWNLETLRILNGEFVKYAASIVRITLERAEGTEPGKSSQVTAKTLDRFAMERKHQTHSEP